MSEKQNEKLANRLSAILIRLNDGERLNIDELARDYSCSTRTLKRDFHDRLIMMDFQEYGPKYYRLDNRKLGYLSDKHIQRFARFAAVQDLFPKIDRDFFQEKLRESVLVKGFQYEDIKGKQNDFDLLSQAIAECRLVEFHYQKVIDKPESGKDYRIAPHRLLNKNGVWYLIGTEQSKVKTFCFTQISRLQLQEEHFERDETLLAEINTTDSIFYGNQISEILIQVNAVVAGYFKRRNLLPNQEIIHKADDGKLLLACKNVNSAEVVPIVQYWLPHLRIISPESIQQQMENGLHEYLGKLL
ncbi:helix-turn-helix transcriptional regulator [Stenoxybacter acetivorans]|uniref:helix-turn-helix transcriptional regulator n=1 Tax=Stenoxybacter acetivorans TaxID=422441 RepID=UPI00056C3306|nr:WYL domain-containing protein [Stenoxybacter acetivorans]